MAHLSHGSVDISGGAPPFPLGSEVTYRCDEGLFPAGDMPSTCRSVGGVETWRPDTIEVLFAETCLVSMRL